MNNASGYCSSLALLSCLSLLLQSDWHETPYTAPLALCRLDKLRVTGEAFVSGASEVEVRLGSIELTDTRPGASKQITK